MKRILLKFNQLNIKKQYFLLLLCSFFIMLFLSILVLFQARHAILQTSTEYAAMLSASFSSEIALVADQARSISEQIQYDACSTSFLQADDWHKVTAEMINELTLKKFSIQEVNTSVADIAYVNNIMNWSSLYSREQLQEFVADMGSDTEVTSLGIRYGDLPSHKDSPFLVFGAPIYVDYRMTGYIFISIHLSRLSLPAMPDNNTGACFLMTDKQFNTFAFNCEQSLADNIIQIGQFDQLLFSDRANASLTDNAMVNNYAVSYQFVENSDCYVISAVNTRNITAHLKSINILCWTIVAVMLLLLMLVYFALYRNYVIPIRTFNHIIQEIEVNHIRTLKEPLNLHGCEEIRQIGSSFTSLLSSINELNSKIVCTANELYEMELQKKIAELSFLRSQINPHFIYNTLELMQDIASDYPVPQIGKIAVSMGKILRYNVKGESIVPLQQEIEITLAYLNIQQARFHDRITVLTNFLPETHNIPVIKMLLQPLVENAIFHGLEPKNGNGILFLNSFLEGDTLRITIRDNGVGICAKQLEEIQTSLGSPIYDTSKHIGLINTNARIRLQYGQAYGITLESSESEGTCVTLVLPSYPIQQKES